MCAEYIVPTIWCGSTYKCRVACASKTIRVQIHALFDVNGEWMPSRYIVCNIGLRNIGGMGEGGVYEGGHIDWHRWTYQKSCVQMGCLAHVCLRLLVWGSSLHYFSILSGHTFLGPKSTPLVGISQLLSTSPSQFDDTTQSNLRQPPRKNASVKGWTRNWNRTLCGELATNEHRTLRTSAKHK